MANVTALLSELETALRASYPTIAFGLGEKDLPRTDSAPPRITWVLPAVKHEAPEKNRTNPRRLLTRAVTIIAHCWSADPNNPDPKAQYDACEALVHDLLVSLHKSAWGSIQMDGEEWLQPTHADFGHVALVTMRVRIPVVAKTYATVQAKQLQPNIVGSVAGDSNVDWSEP